MKHLPCLQSGDIIDVVSPGSNSNPEFVQMSLNLLTDWGFRPRLASDAFAEHPFHSNTDERRFQLLKKALYAKDSKAVWCLRGGYGANRLMPSLWRLKAPVKAKAVIGYSDITSLHLFLLQKWKWPALHGPLLETLTSGRLTLSKMEEIQAVIKGQKTELLFSLQPMNASAQKLKKLKAPITGGNLTVIQSTFGTPYEIKTAGCILALEEIGERGYRVDRMLEQMKQAGLLKHCKAILFGDFLKGDEPDGKNFVAYAIERFAHDTKIPCFQGLEIGHGEKNRILPFGVPATLNGGRQATLTLTTGFAK